MKTIKILASAAVLALAVSCGAPKQQPTTTVTPSHDVNGVETIVETTKLQGIDMADALNESGTAIVKVPYKWFAGIGTADNKQVAIELAQREAYATISRVFNNAVIDQSERGNVANNGVVQQALTSYWQQVSTSVSKYCEPYGETKIVYNTATRMYEATAKVGLRGDKFNQVLNGATNFKPENLSGEELQQFIDVNKNIMEAAKGGK